MTRQHPLRRALVLSGTTIFLCAGIVSVTAQESSATARRSGPGAMRAAVKRAVNRRLVKIRARAGDTLGLLGDRFGASADEIATINGIAMGEPLQAGRELLIPLPSPEQLTKASAEKFAQHNMINAPEANGISSAETETAWVNVQGVLFRKGSSTRSSAPAQAEVVRGNDIEKDSAAPGNTTLAKIVEVSEAERSTSAQPVWIYLVGGARVEADSANETAEGVWYTRGSLSIFIERSHIERIERERVAAVSESAPAWAERGWSTGNPKFDALIRENGALYQVDPYLIFCVMEQESQFKPWVVSPKGARGLMQLMPGTAAHFGVRRPLDPAENIMGGTKYLKQLLENFNGRVDLVLASYNAGEGAVMKYGGNVPPYKETRNYVQRISKRYGQSRSAAAPVLEPAAAASSATAAASGLR